MTIDISNNNPRISYSVAAGVTQTSFAVPFEFFDDTDLNVYVDGVLKTITTDYTVTGGSGSTGTITMTVVGATSGSTVVLTRDTTIERTTDFTAGVDINRAALNTQLDTLTAIGADVKDQAERAIRVSDLEIAPNLVLPSINDRANKLMMFDTEGAVSVASEAALGNIILGANYITDSFTGDGSTTAFILQVAPNSKNNTQVHVDGVYQNKATYSLNDTTLTFSEAPPLNASIEVVSGDSISEGATANSSAVDYNQGGTGAVDRTVKQKLQEIISVKDFGAVGDGVTDDTAAIQAAIDAVASGGSGALSFEQGESYIVTDKLTVFNREIIFEGNNCRITLNANADYLFYVEGVRCVFKDFRFSKSAGVTATGAFLIKNSLNHKFHNLGTSNSAWPRVFHMQNAKECHFSEIRVDNDVSGKTGDIFYMDYSVNNTFSDSMLGYCDNVFRFTTATEPSSGYRSEGITVVNLITVYANIVFKGDFVTAVHAVSCIFDFCETGFSSLTNGHDFSVSNSWIAMVDGSTGIAVAVTNNFTKTRITDCFFVGNGSAPTATFISCNQPELHVAGNTIDNLNGGTVTDATSNVIYNRIVGSGTDINTLSGVTYIRDTSTSEIRHSGKDFRFSRIISDAIDNTFNGVRFAKYRSTSSAGVIYSQLGDAPIMGTVKVQEEGTANYLYATYFKRNNATSPVVTTLANNVLTAGAVNAGGTFVINNGTGGTIRYVVEQTLLT